MKTNVAITPMRIDIADDDLTDLRQRLRQTRWAPPVASSGWADGTDGEYLRDLVNYWATDYDWRTREARLNTFDHAIATVDGTRIHLIHAKGQGPNTVPLLLMQGWPSSFVQQMEIIPLLNEERRDGTPSFDVVVASTPGYPFSEMPTQHGMSYARIADLIVKLMVDGLGYEWFAARGSDQGGLVQQQIGLKYPERLIGLHRSGIYPFASPMPTDLTPAEIAYQAQIAEWAPRETLYARLHGTRPETLTPALADSPVALASWYIEKFQRWGDCKDGVDAQFGRDALLDNLSLHWFTGSGAAAIRLYREFARDPGLTGRVTVPTAIMMPLRDGITIPAPREWAERRYNVQRWTVTERGGHFPEWEAPQATADDIRHFFGDLLRG
ncbi:MAG TPA: epoxide hydrolase [Capsulimonadaceae bacterium]|jgi:pimeloyl-ACP methyl ester carboxylesterase